MGILNKTLLSVAVMIASSAISTSSFASIDLVADLSPGEKDSKLSISSVGNDYLYFYKYINQNSSIDIPRYYRLSKQGIIKELPLSTTGSTNGIPNEFIFPNDEEIWLQKPDLSVSQLYEAPRYNSNNPDDTTILNAQAEIFAQKYENDFLYVILTRRDERYSASQEPENYYRYELIRIDIQTAEVESLDDNYVAALDEPLPTPRFILNDPRYSSTGQRYTFWTVNKDGMGEELWAKFKNQDGAVRTRLTEDINPGSKSSFPGNFVSWGDDLYFHANGESARELYRIDSDDTVQRVADINPNGSAFEFSQYERERYHIFKDELYFLADNGEHGKELWKTNGTEAGTTLIADANPSGDIEFDTWRQDYYQYSQLWDGSESFGVGITAGDRFFYRLTIDGDKSIWYTDGTTAGTRKAMDEPPGGVDHAFAAGDSFFVSFNAGYPRDQLYHIGDGNNIDPQLILDADGSISLVEGSDLLNNGVALLQVLIDGDIQL